MNPILRFWVLVITFGIGFGASGYLFVSIWAPEAYLVTAGTEIRLVLTGVAFVGIGTFVWAALFARPDEPEMTAAQNHDSGGRRDL